MSHNNVVLFIPNIIGYLRILFMMVAFYFFFSSPLLFMLNYSLSALLDVADGMAARKLDQCSLFGGALDMVTDRLTSTIMAAYLGYLFPELQYYLALFIMLDIGGHWLQIYRTLLCNEKHHKEAKFRFSLVKFYYTDRKVLFLVCFGAEAFFVSLYVFRSGVFPVDSFLYNLNSKLVYLFGVVFIFKQITTIVSMCDAVSGIVDKDVEMRLARKNQPVQSEKPENKGKNESSKKK